jgi:hypothetical protein
MVLGLEGGGGYRIHCPRRRTLSALSQEGVIINRTSNLVSLHCYTYKSQTCFASLTVFESDNILYWIDGIAVA